MSDNYSEHHQPCVSISSSPLDALWVQMEARGHPGVGTSPALASRNTIFSPICSSWVTTQWVECVAGACQAHPPPSTAGIKCSLFFVILPCHHATMESFTDWPWSGLRTALSCLFTAIDKIQTKFLIFQIDKWFPGVLILTNVISHNGGWGLAVCLMLVILVGWYY